MIAIEHLSKSFGKVHALRDVSLTCDPGECIALIGPNGCGKTTLIKAILGMVVPDKGRILVNGRSIRGDVSYRGQIGYMPQIGRYPENMTIRQMVAMIMDIRKSSNGQDRELLDAYQLESLYQKRMGTLSGGMRQKVGATLAFLFDPDILLLDEPTAGLDPLASEILKDKIIKERAKGKLLLITSHVLSELDELVTQVIFMHEGEIRFHLSTDELRQTTGETTIFRAITQVMKSAMP